MKGKWLKGLAISLVIFSIFSLYLFLRRGYYDLYIINKVFGSTAAVLAGLTLLVGPLSRKFPIFAWWMLIRRHLGLLALGFALAHVMASVFFLPNKFPLSWYQREWMPILFGTLALFIWIYLAYISSNKKIQELGVDVWKKHQSLGGRIAFLAIYFHLVVMKYPGWLRWFDGQIKPSPQLANPSYPPASLFVFIIMTAVILYRIVNSLLVKSRS